jgi:hypothetical protein
VAKCFNVFGQTYAGNRAIGFSTCGENYLSGFSLLSLLGLAPKAKRGRPRGSKDSVKRLRSCRRSR